MQNAIIEAKKCTKDVPIGCVIKKDGQIIASAHNRRELDDDVTAHAEILAIKEAQRVLGTSRLKSCEMYVTLEPCPMCAGALINSRIDRVIYGASDPMAGCCGSVINFNSYPFNHAFSLTGGVCADDCRELLKSFFEKKR